MKKQNNNFVKVIHILRDGHYHDGTSIGEKLRMTRSAVWKTIKRLQHYEVAIESVKGKGYVLTEPLIMLEKNKIERQVQAPVMLEVFETISSTNDYLKSLKKSPHISYCLSEQQSEGRGRFNRKWYSPFGKNIYLSCRYAFRKDISELAGLSLLIGLAVVKTLNSYGSDSQFLVKWPNDVVYEDKKISGNLIEIQAESHGMSYAIIGIGINVNMQEKALPITQDWTSLQKILNAYVDRNELAARLINQLTTYLHEFEKHGFVSFAEEWRKADSLKNKMITLKEANEKISGKVVGVNEQGHLLLQLPNRQIRAFSSGEASLKLE